MSCNPCGLYVRCLCTFNPQIHTKNDCNDYLDFNSDIERLYSHQKQLRHNCYSLAYTDSICNECPQLSDCRKENGDSPMTREKQHEERMKATYWSGHAFIEVEDISDKFVNRNSGSIYQHFNTVSMKINLGNVEISIPEVKCLIKRK